MAREIVGKDALWSAVEREHARAQTNEPSPDAVDGAPSATIQTPPEPPTTNAVDATAQAAQADGDTQAPPAPVDSAASEPAEPQENDDDAIARLAAMRPIEYERVRKEEAKALGVSVPVLDAEVKAARSKEAIAERMPFTDVEPWREPVLPAELLHEIATTTRTFVIVDREQADAAALWVVHSYMTELFDVSPIALITAPERACGKTQLQTLLGRMCYRPLFAANASLSAIFRAIASWRPTLLIYEADAFFAENAELHGVINAGFQRGGAVLRSEAVGDRFEPTLYDVYCAKSIAGIALQKVLPDSTLSRGILLKMRRRLAHERTDRLRDADRAMFDRIRAKCARFAIDYAQRVRQARPKLPDELSDRQQDCWSPLLAIAQCAGQEWVDRATKAAKQLSDVDEAQTSISNMLISDIRGIFDRWPDDRIKSGDLIEKLCADEERPWATFNRGKQMTPRQLARLLSPYGIKPGTVRMPDSSTPKGYFKEDFTDVFRRYLPPAQGPSDDDGSAAAKVAQQFCRIDPLGSESSLEAGDDSPAPPEDDYL